MTNAEKLLAKLLRKPTEMRYEEVAKVLEFLGWTEARRTGSHHQWTKPERRTLPTKVHGTKVDIAVIGNLKERFESREL